MTIDPLSAAELVALAIGLALLRWRSRTAESIKLWIELSICGALAVYLAIDCFQGLVVFSYFVGGSFVANASIKRKQWRNMVLAAFVGLAVYIDFGHSYRYAWIAVIFVLALVLPLLRGLIQRRCTEPTPGTG